MDKTKRIAYLDMLRIISCISVLIIHIFTTARTDFPDHSLLQDYISRTIPGILHFTVPIFFMITGYLFINKSDKYTYKEFFIKYTLKYIIGIIVFGGTFAIMEEIMTTKAISIKTIYDVLINILSGKSWAHMWYLYTLVGIMLIIPVFIKMKENKEKTINYLICILIVSSVICPFIKNIFDVEIGIRFPVESVYLLYALLGYKIGNNIKSYKLSVNILGIIIPIICILIAMYLQVYKGLDLFKSIGDYNSPIILIETICLFNLTKRWNGNIKKLGEIISYNSYGIYIWHMLPINLLYKLFKYNIYDNFMIGSIVVFTITIISSNIIVVVLKKMPLIKKII